MDIALPVLSCETYAIGNDDSSFPSSLVVAIIAASFATCASSYNFLTASSIDRDRVLYEPTRVRLM